jgi:hypothetical protein
MFGAISDYLISFGHGDQISHTPLLPDLDEIRVLQLLSPTSATMHTVPRNSAPAYVALSYAWGDPRQVAPYTVNDQKVLISKSLSLALKRVFTYLQRDPGETYLWADAICINQADNDEKASQVASMKSIYQRAVTVIVHLDLDAHNSMSDGAYAVTNSWFWYQQGNGHQTRSKLPSLSGHPTLVSFFNQPWWNRIWTLQEVACNSKAIILYGSTGSLDWSRVLKFAPHWQDREALFASHSSDSCNAASQIFAGGLGAKLAFSKARYKGTFPWLSALVATANFASTDPRDRLYALAGVCPPLPGMEISYTKPTADVFRDFTKAMISHHNDLEILQLAGLNHDPHLNPHNLPSWVPNFANLKSPALQYYKLLGTKQAMKCMQDAFKFWNAAPSVAKLEPGNAVSDFRPRGMQIGHVDKVVAPLPGARTDPGWLRAAFEHFGSEYRAPTMVCHVLQAYFRLLFGDRYENEGERLLEYGGRFDLAGSFWHTFRGVIGQLLQQMDLSAGIDMTLLGETRQDGYGMKVQYGTHSYEVAVTALDKFSSLHFFITANGYMGYGPKCQSGDLICILFGCSVPLILRPQGGGHIILGQCFVLGVMNGELYQDQDAGQLDDLEGVQVFDIL